MPPRRKKLKPRGDFLDELPANLSNEDVNVATDSSERKKLKSSKSHASTKVAKSMSRTTQSGECFKKQIARKKNSQSDLSLHQAKLKRRGSKSGEIVHGPSSSKSKTKKNISAKPIMSPTRLLTNNDDESSHEDAEEIDTKKKYPPFPAVGDEIAIKCPAEPPHPEGWYAAVVLDVILNDQENFDEFTPANHKKSRLDFTLHVEWDGGGVEELKNPDWRMKGDEPDKNGRISHRDSKLRPYFRYWVNRLNSMSESEQKLNQIRQGKNIRPDPNHKVEWIQCANPNCGKWRPLPFYLKSSSVLQSCNNTWFCVLNSWDDATASCGAPQETGYMSNNT